MKRISFLAAAITVALTGCGGGDGDSSGGTPAPSYEINDTLVQDSIRVAQSGFFRTGRFNNQTKFTEIIDNNPFGPDIPDAGGYCNYGLCPESIGLSTEEYQLVRDNLESFSESGGGTVRYRNINEVNGVDLGNPVDSDGQSRLQTIIINNNEVLTPERRQMILDAVAQIQIDAGVKLFNDEILDIDLSKITVDEYVEDLNAHTMTYRNQNKNTWVGNTYHDGGAIKYDASTATDDNGDLKDNNSYEKLVDKHGVRGGIIISWGTAMATTEVGCTVKPENGSIVKANVSGFPYIGNEFGLTVDKNGYATNSNFSWVNLGQYTKYCHNIHFIDQETILHELGHAIGLNDHFDGFGIGGVWDDRAKAVLRSLYNTPVGTPYDQMTVVE